MSKKTSTDQQSQGSLDPVVLPRAAVQRLEAWMREVTDLLCYQPEVPMTHKTCVVDAMLAFARELEAAHKKRQND